MTVGSGFSIFLLVVGAILTFAVDVTTEGFRRSSTTRIERDLP